MTESKPCPIDPTCEIDAKGFHKNYHLAPTAKPTVVAKAKKCALCGREIDKCNDKVDLVDSMTGIVIYANVSIVKSKNHEL